MCLSDIDAIDFPEDEHFFDQGTHPVGLEFVSDYDELDRSDVDELIRESNARTIRPNVSQIDPHLKH